VTVVVADTQLPSVVAFEAPMRALVAGLDPNAVPLFDAPRMFEAFALLERLVASGKTLIAARAEAACTWQ